MNVISYQLGRVNKIRVEWGCRSYSELNEAKSDDSREPGDQSVRDKATQQGEEEASAHVVGKHVG